MNYKVTGGYVKDSQTNTVVTFATAFDNWVTRAALKRGRNHWMQMHRELFSNNPQLKPRWHDYKPALTAGQIQGTTVTQWVPEDYNNATLPHDDRGQTFSKFVTEDGQPRVQVGTADLVDTDKDEFTSHIVGSHITQIPAPGELEYTSIGLIESWVNSRPDIEPIQTISDSELDTISDDPLNLLFNDGDADNEIIENFNNAINDDGDQEGDAYPMYANEVINALEEVACASTNPSAPVSYFTGFNALTGQVMARIKVGNNYDRNTDNVEFVFEVEPKGMKI